MFDELIREIRKLEKPVSIPIDMPVDDKGYFDRKCPHTECGGDFKVLFEDWKHKVPDEEAFCPKCGERNEPQEFNTPWQQKYIADFAQAYMARQVQGALKRATSRTRPMKMSAGLFSMEMKLTYSPGRQPVVLTPEAQDVLRQDLVCEKCQCRYSTLGAGFFCPACGHNSPLADFQRTVEIARKTIEKIDDVTTAMSTIHDADFAATFRQQLLEDQIENLVTAFQRCTESQFANLPNAPQFPRDTNLFQRLPDASALWLRATGRDYEAFLSQSEMAVLQTMIQRRHKIGHCQGIVDERYVQNSGDQAYRPGQRLVTTADHVQELAAILEKLVTGILSLLP